MSIAAISSSNFLQVSGVPPSISQGRANVLALEQSLQSGDLAGAQQAYDAISAAGTHFHNAQLATDFTALGSAIDSGDLAGAQQALVTLQNAIQTLGGSGNGGHVQPEVVLNLSSAATAAAAAATPVASTNSSSSSSTTAPITSSVGSSSTTGSTSGSTASTTTTTPTTTATPEIVLNFGSGSSDASGITLNLNENGVQQLGISVSNTSSGEQVTLNVGNGSSSTEQIQLNLAENQALAINLIA